MSLRQQRLTAYLQLRLQLGPNLVRVGLLLASTFITAIAVAIDAPTKHTAGIDPPTTDASVALLKNLEFPTGTPVAYEETQMNPMLKEPVTQRGFVEITPGGAFVMQVTSPRPEQRRLENGKLSLKRPSKAALRRNPSDAIATARLRTVTLNPEHGGHLVLLTITHVLSGDIAALSQNYDFKSTPGEPWSVVLTPKNAKVKQQLQRLELKGIKGHLHSLYTQRSSEAWQQLSFIASKP